MRVDLAMINCINQYVFQAFTLDLKSTVGQILHKIRSARYPFHTTINMSHVTICFISISTPLGMHNSLQNQSILKIKKRLKIRALELSSSFKLISEAQTVKKC